MAIDGLPDRVELTAASKTMRGSLAMNAGELLLRGPDRLSGSDGTRFRVDFRIWTYRPWIGPKHLATVYLDDMNGDTQKADTRIVRFTDWDFSTCRVAAMRSSYFDLTSLRSELFAANLDSVAFHALIGSLIASTALLPALGRGPVNDADAEPGGSVVGFQRDGHDVSRTIEWMTGSTKEADDSWTDVWSGLLSSRQTQPRSDLEPTYLIDPLLGIGA
jgi:hypothetical protein